ncbi:MAG TPA: ubiquinol oxidase subunit II [Candidatus Saccharimonadales bacterium]
MTNKQKLLAAGLAIGIVALFCAAIFYFSHVNVAVLNPQGVVGNSERDLIVFTVILSLLVVVPVFTLLGVFAWKYRDTNTKKVEYKPEWDSDKILETIWWGIPCVVILALSIVTWQTSHSLDPFRPLNVATEPLRVQVVALQWKWLFIYPDQGVASVNELEIPEKTPINFEITSDAPMNAFWVPSLGSQIYAMSGMSTQLHLMADKVGEYKGSSTNISGTGFADMTFSVHAVANAQFKQWVEMARGSEALTTNTYAELAKPGTMQKTMHYMVPDTALYDSIVAKYSQPAPQHTTMPMNMGGM